MLSKNITSFYENKCIFITGATGLLGKSIIEKLLRTCGGLKCIYVLIRPKRGVNVEDRLQNLLSSEVFDLVRDEDPRLLGKITALEGDVIEEDFGLSLSNIELLTNNVSIVIHSAATVRFDEPLRLAVDMNLVPVVKLIELVQRFVHLEVMVHISTAYSNCDEQVIEERIYQPSIDPYKLIDIVHCLPESLIDMMTPGLLGKKPNTYTFTKQLAEHVIRQYNDQLPIVIVRPSIIGATVAEPFPGWIDNFNAATGLIAAISKGMLRSMMGDYKKSANIIPVDTTANFIIAAGWYSAGTYRSSLTNGDFKVDELHCFESKNGKTIEGSKSLSAPDISEVGFLPVFNCTLENDKVTWGTFVDALLPRLQHSPSMSCHLFPNFHMTTVAWYHDLKWTFSHIFPAAVLDLLQMVQGKSPRYLRGMDKLRDAVVRLSYFTLNHWHFMSNNKSIVWRAMSDSDKRKFNFELSNIDWVSYLNVYHHGTKKYALKENTNTNYMSITRGKKLRMLYFCLRYTSMVLVLLFMMRKMHVFNGLFCQFVRLLVRATQLLKVF